MTSLETRKFREKSVQCPLPPNAELRVQSVESKIIDRRQAETGCCGDRPARAVCVRACGKHLRNALS